MTTLRELFTTAMIEAGEDPTSAIFLPEDEDKLSEDFKNNQINTDLDDNLIDVVSWCGAHVFISCGNDSEDGTLIYIKAAYRNPDFNQKTIRNNHGR